MDKFIRQQNIKLFREKLLDPTLSPEQRATVQGLLRAAEGETNEEANGDEESED